MDEAIRQFDRILRTLFAPARSARRIAEDVPQAALSEAERRHAAALMRVNHCGEVCAQALYQGQSLTAGDADLAAALRRCAEEEADHLAWTETRIAELGAAPSLLNPLWYSGALALGALAGGAGRDWNLGFLAETERQVEAHLSGHLERLPKADRRSRAILEQMRVEEAGHAARARELGARELPAALRLAMRIASRIMTGTAYRI
ncbi:MAG: 2-polyprenyl-3-methyl-6-methoxy-1,4-benzoquinone monooxygenase [Rhodocyclaceae bacterium]